ncbi:MAG: type I secretion system permease/ATPase [Haliea sp.]|nr:type I secretion system permease/ATPase [Haliea sp.]|tara:strand:+ start:45816 stop:47546 length:1731 start_codon:yes stop_codon:yes gene_type:complete
MRLPARAAGGPVPEELRDALASCRRALWVVGVFSGGINLLLLAPAIYMLQVYDRVLTSGSLPTLVMLTLVVLLLYLAIGGLEWVRGQILLRNALRLDLELEPRAFDMAFRESLYGAGKTSPGQVVSDLAGLRQWLASGGPVTLLDAPWLPIYLLVLYLLHPLFALAGALAAAILIALAVLNARLTGELGQRANMQSAQSHTALQRNLRNAEVVEALGMRGNLHRQWRERHLNVLATQARGSGRGQALTTLARVFRLSAQSLILGLGAWLVIEQRVTPGVMIAASILLGRALAPVDGLIGGWRQWVDVRERYWRLVSALERMPPRPRRMPLPPPEGRVDAEGVSLAPPGEKRLVLRQASFRIEPGEAVGLVGPSGSGKTSLARALVGVWPTVAGTLRLDGAEIFQRDREELGPHVGYLPQDVELFDGSVSANIARFGDIDPQRVVAAAQLAGVHEALLQLPSGYDTAIGEAGATLPAGLRQRIALARALYGRPQLLVLDEPNSNLDDAGERALIDALRREKQRGATIVIISHRNTILAVVERLMVLKEGALVLDGDKKEVMARLSGPRPGHSAGGSA